jgi:23S rRNA pseudouridine1911/1915/1917 synthase
VSGATSREWLNESGGERLDRALARAWDDLSRSRIQDLIRAGHVAVDGERVLDPSRKLAAGAQVVAELPAAAPPEPAGEAIPLDIIHEDADLVVINKPAGLVVHPAAGHETGTLVNALIAHCGATLSGIGGVRRPGIVHRLDKDTSGLLVVAKNDLAHQGLAEQFADHGRTGPLERAYLALLWGEPDRPHGTVEAALARGTHNREKIVVVPEGRGRRAVTRYAVVETLPPRQPAASLVRCELETGRTHQIRVHMAHIGHPLMGDALYGSGFKTKAARLSEAQGQALSALGRQALHAAVLGFEHPRTGETLRFESPLPEDMAKLLECLRNPG